MLAYLDELSRKMEIDLHGGAYSQGSLEDAVFIPTFGSEEELAHAAYLASLADPSRQGKRLAQAAQLKIGPVQLPRHYDLVSASPVSDLSGVNLGQTKFREGSFESIEKWIRKIGGHIHCQVRKLIMQIAEQGDSAVVIASEKMVLGVVILKAAKHV